MPDALSVWFRRNVSIRDDVTAIRSARLRQQASMEAPSRNAAAVKEARSQDEMRRVLVTLFAPDAQNPRIQALLFVLRDVGYDIMSFDVHGEWQDAYREARAANPGRRVIMLGFSANDDGPARGYVCTGSEGGDVAAMTAFQPLTGKTLFGRMRCRTHTRLLRLEGVWVDIRAQVTLMRWRWLPAHMQRHWAPREGQVVSRRGERASAFLDRVVVAEIERQVRMMERAGKVHIPV